MRVFFFLFFFLWKQQFETTWGGGGIEVKNKKRINYQHTQHLDRSQDIIWSKTVHFKR